MRISELKRELRVVQELIAMANPKACFAEDILCLEMNRRALLATLSIELKKNSPALRQTAPALQFA